MSTQADIRALATRFFDAVEHGDIATVRDCYAPGARIWHNTDDAEQGPDENAAVLTGFVERIPQRTYANRRLQVFDDGFVQQHELQGVRRDGGAVRLSACIVCKVEGGKISRLDEYFDSAQVATFREPARP